MRSTHWVRRLPAVDWEKACRCHQRKTCVFQKPSSVVPGRRVGLEEAKLHSRVSVRYLYQPEELEGGRWRHRPRVVLQVYRPVRSMAERGGDLLPSSRHSVGVRPRGAFTRWLLTLGFCWIESSDVEDCTGPSSSVATSQLHVVVVVAFGIVQTVDTELLGVLWLEGPEKHDVTGSTAIILSFSALQDVVHLQGKSPFLGIVLALVSHKLPLNSF